jgi:ABC-type cobalt transport system substrate-binding protein
MPLEMSYQLVTSTGTFHPVYTGVDSQANVGVVALFKDAAGGSDPFPAAYQPPSQMIESALLRM